MTKSIPVITIDGPSGSGKGTISKLLAKKLGWHYLDSGALYRVVALAAIKQNIEYTNVLELEKIVLNLDVVFAGQHITLNGVNVTKEIRTETCGIAASQVAAIPVVRSTLLERQRKFRQSPGLVADGRDMGTVVFPDAATKFFLTASREERAKRRYQQLQEQELHVSLRDTLQDIDERDARDEQRSISPLAPAEGAITIDTTDLSINGVLQTIMDFIEGLY